MIPKKGSDKIFIPITFDMQNRGMIQKSGRGVWLFVITVVWLFTSILFLIAAEPFWKVMYPVLSFIICSSFLRFIVYRERYYRKQRQELIDTDYKFDQKIFWNIYEIGSAYPYVYQFKNNLKGIFVSLEKGATVGRQEDDDYYHYEAIALAYQEMAKRGLVCKHIDYMDTVGRDDRLNGLFEISDNAENPDLKKLLLHFYDNIEYKMSKVYVSYDVYCFLYTGRDDIAWEDIKGVLQCFKLANYSKFKVLNREEISKVVKAVVNIEDFSVNRACESLFKDSMYMEYIKPIWVEKDGEKTILNKTTEELQALRQVVQAERKLKKVRKPLFGKKKKEAESIEIDLFE